METIQEPTQKLQLKSIHTCTSTRTAQPDADAFQTNPEEANPVATENEASGVDRNHDLYPPQASVNINGEIANPTARNNGLVRRRSTVKAIKEEGRAASEFLKAKMRELHCLQEINGQLEKDENSALSGHRAAMKVEHSLGLALLASKARHESALIDLSSKESRLNTCRERSLQQSEILKQKQEEVEELKQRKVAEDRERRQRISQEKKRHDS
ncbi:hypothetical protein Clacol_002847 [Clathrus columnatus]|uniref:Uncharacterized protein n=1 Tax=Clathrus columnatus TaxID=1419009 RepID=A0AAV5A582_9AGAM|nr:hypothetical protein Clacol_002847 [Clathrus columnatus]